MADLTLPYPLETHYESSINQTLPFKGGEWQRRQDEAMPPSAGHGRCRQRPGRRAGTGGAPARGTPKGCGDLGRTLLLETKRDIQSR